MARKKSGSRRKWFFILLVLALCGYVGYNYYLIARQANTDESRNVDVIVVFGAAEYAGKPSPIYKSRLDHAAELYRRKLAPLIITTGGHGNDPQYTEGGVGRDYLIDVGIPEAKAIAETQSEDTADSAERVAAIMRANRLKTCLAVSDAYHLYRIKQMMAKQGITAYGAPRKSKQLTEWQRAGFYLREVFSLTLWRLGLT
jgi:uncharacterized SAM-binding protein YcdF (DUF218 family)